MTEKTTTLSIDAERFCIDGRATYAGRYYHGRRVEGLLFGVRAAQATFDDENWPAVRSYDFDSGEHSFAYPDTEQWDPERNVDEFCAALPAWKAYGISCVTLHLQGGRPILNAWKTRPDAQPWVNVAFEPDGQLKPAYAKRMARAVAALDRLGMIACVSFFYFGQAPRLNDDDAVRRAIREGMQFLTELNRKNVMVEIAQEVARDWQTIQHYLKFRSLALENVHHHIRYAKEVGAGVLPVSTSLHPAHAHTPEIIEAADFLLPHGNNRGPEGHIRIVREIRAMAAYRDHPKPIFFNEASPDLPDFQAAFQEGASWAYYDHGANDYVNGFQSPPINWTVNTCRKAAYFERVRDITGGG